MKNETIPLVSILIANFNNGEFITDTLDSARNQKYSNIEIIIVDDGSTDNSINIIDNYIKDHGSVQIKLFKNDDNKGCGRVKRQCIELSNGQYFAFLDPEDTITSDAIEKLVAIHEQSDSYSIVYSTHFLCNSKLEIQRISSWPGKIPDGQSNLTSTGGHISAFAMCKRKDYNLTTGINPTYYVAEDMDLYLKMEEVAPVFYLDEPLYFYRKHDHNTSWNILSKQNNYYWSYQASLAAYRRRKKDKKNNIDNLSKIEMDKMTLSHHVRQRKIEYQNNNYWEWIKQIFYCIPYIYTMIIK